MILWLRWLVALHYIIQYVYTEFDLGGYKPNLTVFCLNNDYSEQSVF